MKKAKNYFFSCHQILPVKKGCFACHQILPNPKSLKKKKKSQIVIPTFNSKGIPHI